MYIIVHYIYIHNDMLVMCMHLVYCKHTTEMSMDSRGTHLKFEICIVALINTDSVSIVCSIINFLIRIFVYYSIVCSIH